MSLTETRENLRNAFTKNVEGKNPYIFVNSLALTNIQHPILDFETIDQYQGRQSLLIGSD